MPTWGDVGREIDRASQEEGFPQGASPFDFVRRRYLRLLAEHTGRSVIQYASKWTQGAVEPDAISITPEDVQGFMQVIHGLSNRNLDLILHSPGGSAEVTESLVRYLRSKFRNVRVLVPYAAMSAASMLACSANRIVMGKHSFLGPIDPQFILQTELGRSSVPAHAVLEQFKKAQEECRDPALLPSWLPMLRQYGPALIVQCQWAIELSESMVSEWLARYMFRGQRDAEKKAKKTASAMADHSSFKTHGRFIARDQARRLGLTVDDLERDQKLQDLLLSVFHATTHTFAGTPVVKLIENQMGRGYLKLQQQVILVQQPPEKQGS